MAGNRISIIESVGADYKETERVISSTEFAIKRDGQIKQPAVTTEIEIENDGNTERTTDQCGNTERRRRSNKGWLIRVTGIVTANDERNRNLSLQFLRDVVANAESVLIRSDVTGSGLTRFEVSNTVITQSSDLVSVETGETDGPEQAFEFQLQLGESEADN